MEFVNDPQFDGLPLVGAGHVLVAKRTECGRAARWVPGGDVVALAEFLGPAFPVVGDKVFEQRADGSLFPLDLVHPFWAFVPPAGDPVLFQPVGLTSGFAQVVADVAAVVTGDSAVDAAETYRQGHRAGYEAAVNDLAALAADAPSDESSAGAPSGDAGDSSLPAGTTPADVPVKRGPGRPKKVVADV